MIWACEIRNRAKNTDNNVWNAMLKEVEQISHERRRRTKSKQGGESSNHPYIPYFS
jgi:hypothetical protein